MVGGGSWPRRLCPENLEDSGKLLFCKRALHQMRRWGVRHGNVGQGETAGNNEPFQWSSLYRHVKLSGIKKLKRPLPSPFKISFDKILWENMHCYEDFLNREMYSHFAIVGKYKNTKCPQLLVCDSCLLVDHHRWSTCTEPKITKIQTEAVHLTVCTLIVGWVKFTMKSFLS